MRVPFTSSLQGYFDIWWEKGTNVKCNPFFSFPWKIPKVFGKCKTLSNSNVENWLSVITETLWNLNNPFLSVQVFNRTVLNEVTLQKKTSSTWDKVHLSFTRWNRKLGLGNQMVALLAPFEKPQWHGLPIEKRRWKFSIPVGLSSYISCGHSGHAEFYSFFQLDAAYWSRPVDRTLDLLVMEWRCRLRKHLYRIAYLNSLL